MAQFQIQLIISCANQTDEKIIYHFTFKKLKYFFTIYSQHWKKVSFPGWDDSSIVHSFGKDAPVIS